MCMPGDHVSITVELIDPIAIEKGLKFAIREGGRTVGSAPSQKSSNKQNLFLLATKSREETIKNCFSNDSESTN